MKKINNLFATLITGISVVGLVLNFNACSEQSPLQPGDNKEDVSISVLAKKGNTRNLNDTVASSQSYSSETSGYPQSGFVTLSIQQDNEGLFYAGGTINLTNQSKFSVRDGALTPPPGTPPGADVTITMLVEKDEALNELRFTFGPSGSRFNPPAEIRFNWTDLNSNKAKLYYIDPTGNYIEQTPDYIDIKNKFMTIYVDHFSRYAVAWSR